LLVLVVAAAVVPRPRNPDSRYLEMACLAALRAPFGRQATQNRVLYLIEDFDMMMTVLVTAIAA
jgi:hypothetical protein